MATNPSRNKRKGADWEVDLTTYLRDQLYDVERLARAGRLDEGDLRLVHNRRYFVIEAKAPGAGQPIQLKPWTREAEVEAANFAKARDLTSRRVFPVVAVKATRYAASESYIVMKMDTFLRLLEKPPGAPRTRETKGQDGWVRPSQDKQPKE